MNLGVCVGDLNLFVVLLWFSPDLGIAFVIHLNVDSIGSAADRTIFDIRLTRTFCQVDRDNDDLSTSIANVVAFFLRRGINEGRLLTIHPR